MADSRKARIQQSLVTRLKTITNANGYDTDVKNVFSDEIPMGLDLDSYELPAVLVIAGPDKPKHEHQCIKGRWQIEVQLIHLPDVSDTVMLNFVRDVNKAVYANSPTVHRNDAWRTFDGQPTAIWILDLDTDLNMIDGNRFAGVTYLVEYHSTPTDL